MCNEKISKRESKSVHTSIRYCLVNITSRAHWEQERLMLILQSGASRPLEKKRLQRDDVIKRAPVKPQTNGNNIEKNDANVAFMFASCIDLRNVTALSRLTYLMFSSLHWTLSLFHCTVLHFAFIDTPSFLSQPSVKFSVFTHKNGWMETHWHPILQL